MSIHRGPGPVTLSSTHTSAGCWTKHYQGKQLLRSGFPKACVIVPPRCSSSVIADQLQAKPFPVAVGRFASGILLMPVPGS